MRRSHASVGRSTNLNGIADPRHAPDWASLLTRTNERLVNWLGRTWDDVLSLPSKSQGSDRPDGAATARHD